MNGIPKVPRPTNEPIRGYGLGARERRELKKTLSELSSEVIDVPVVIGGREIRTGDRGRMVCPHDHQHVLGHYHKAGAEEVEAAADEAASAWKGWQETPWEERAAVLLRAAELLAGPYRDRINAATMLGQSKNVFQAEIDAACELIDFWRFNPFYAQSIYADQPPISPTGFWNRLEHRPLEGFVAAITPFNFTSIAGNLPTAPILMGNTVLWKPASSAVYSAWHIFQLLREAGLPDGVLNFLPGSGSQVGTPMLTHRNLAGVHFTGSTSVFRNMWSTIGQGIASYRCYPRIVGETGGKDFVFAHPSANLAALSAALLRGAFEYQGQKCSAASRAYIPESLWPALKERLVEGIRSMAVGPVEDFRNFVNAVIDKKAFQSIATYLDHARESAEAKIVVGGGCNDEVGFFVEPTLIEAVNPMYESMLEEIFGPVLTVFVYPDGDFAKTLELCDKSSPYALTGAFFSRDRKAIVDASRALAFSAGNFYVNDKPTGAVVGQQPFGGARGSGTNDKAGSALNLLRWTSQRTIKENFLPPEDYRYPFMAEA